MLVDMVAPTVYRPAMKYHFYPCAVAWIVFANACGNEPPSNRDSQILDGQVPDTQTLDSARDNAVQDVATSDANGFGFAVRAPHTVTLSTSGGPMDFPTQDFGCTLRAGGNNAVVYVQATPTGAFEGGLASTPTFANVRGWLHDRNTMTTREVTATYEWGGGHHNDFFDLTVGTQHFRYYHSSFGFGFRKCQAVDCVQIRTAGGDVSEDGCTEARTLPEICVEITNTTFPALSSDTFVPCRR